MKCIQCGTDNKLRDRTANQGRCKNCNHQFAFEPTSMTGVKFTDPVFANAIADLSANDILFFTPKQLFYFLDKRLNRKFRNARKLPAIGIFIWGFIASIIFKSGLLFFIGVVVGLVLIVWRTRQRTPKAGVQQFIITPNQFQNWVERWTELNNIAKMLPSPRTESLPATISSDISDYSFDRVVVCDSPAIAQLLIANNFHFENNCAILSITGYPQNIFDTVMQMLRRNSDLKVYALHDASPRGVRLIHRLRTNPKWFKNSNVTIYDLGLLPRQILKSPNVFVQATDESAQQAKQLPAAVRQDLTKEELEWLEAGKLVELESFTPQKLLQVITQGIAKSQAPDSSDGLVPVDGGGSHVFIFAADSFG